MQMHEAEEVLELRDLYEANTKLGQGWFLLAVVSAQGEMDSKMRPTYILGRKKPKKSLPVVNPEKLADLGRSLG